MEANGLQYIRLQGTSSGNGCIASPEELAGVRLFPTSVMDIAREDTYNERYQ